MAESLRVGRQVHSPPCWPGVVQPFKRPRRSKREQVGANPIPVPLRTHHILQGFGANRGETLETYRVNSKATLKVPLATLFPLVPRLLHPQLRASRYTTERSQALVIQSDESRQQATNVDLCYAKLNQLLASSAKEVIPGETSQEQKDRVSKL